MKQTPSYVSVSLLYDSAYIHRVVSLNSEKMDLQEDFINYESSLKLKKTPITKKNVNPQKNKKKKVGDFEK